MVRGGSMLRPVADDALVEFQPLVVVVDGLLRIHDLEGLALPHQAAYRRIVVLVCRHAVYFRVEALAVGQHVVVEKRRGAGVGRAARDRDCGGQHDGGRKDEPVDRRGFRLHALGVVAVDPEHQRNLSGCDQDRAVIVSGAHRNSGSVKGEFIFCSSFSRASTSICGALVSSTSNSKRPPRVSLSTRCRICAWLPRQNFTVTPYRRLKSATSLSWSSCVRDEYSISSPSFLAAPIRRSVRSAPWYEATARIPGVGSTAKLAGAIARTRRTRKRSGTG